jgi:uncharacterized membrane protein YhaH (DUF805 family)
MQNQLTFAGAVKKAFQSWRDYRSVSSRREYWFFVLFTVLVSFASQTVDRIIACGQTSTSMVTFSTLVQLVLYLWLIPLVTRRYHDVGLSGWWQLIAVVPVSLAIYKIPAITILLNDPNFRLASNNVDLTEEQSFKLLNEVANAFGWLALAAFLVSAFQLVVTLLPSRPSWRGNRFAPVTEPVPVWGYAAPSATPLPAGEHPASSDNDDQ